MRKQAVVFKVVFALFLLSCPYQANAAQIELVKEYLTQINFRGGLEQDVRRFIPKTVTNDKKEQFISLINFALIEDSYANEVANKMTDQEVRALIQANSIPGFQSAVKKQASTVGVVMNLIFKEIEGAAKRVGATSSQGR